MERFETTILNIETVNDTNNNMINSTQKLININQDAIYHSKKPTYKKVKVRKNPFENYFPIFYKKELKISLYTMIAWSIFLCLSIFLFSFATFKIISNEHISNWLICLTVPLLLIVIGLFTRYFISYLNFKNESNTINFKDEKTLSFNIKKKYLALKTGHININWFSTLFYTLLVIAFIVNCVCCFLISHSLKSVFVFSINQNFNNFTIATWIMGVLLIIGVMTQITLLVYGYLRFSRIENFYNFEIISKEEINSVKKKNNIRNSIIYFLTIFSVFFLIFVVYKTVKRKKQTNITIKN